MSISLSSHFCPAVSSSPHPSPLSMLWQTSPVHSLTLSILEVWSIPISRYRHQIPRYWSFFVSSKQVKCKIYPECLFFMSTHWHSQQCGHAVTLKVRPHATVSYALLVTTPFSVLSVTFLCILKACESYHICNFYIAFSWAQSLSFLTER